MIASLRWPRQARRPEASIGSETHVPESSRPRCSTLASIDAINRSGSKLTTPAIPHIKTIHRLHRKRICEICGSDLERTTLAEGIEHTESGAAGRGQLVETDRRCPTLQHTRANRSHLFLLAFVLHLQHDLLFASIFVKRRAA